MYGDSGNDSLDGGIGNDALFGGSGRDLFFVSKGDDTITGGKGVDLIDYSQASAAVNVSLHKHTGAGFGTQTISGVENIEGSMYGDRLIGDKRANVIDGGAGNDVIRGFTGADILTGGSGKDTFTFTKKDLSDGTTDHITDFKLGVDRLNLSHMAKSYEVTDEADGTHISLNGHDIVVLNGLHDMSLQDLVAAKSLVL